MTRPARKARKPKPDPIKALLKRHPGPLSIENYGTLSDFTVYDKTGKTVVSIKYGDIDISKTRALRFARAIARLGGGK